MSQTLSVAPEKMARSIYLLLFCCYVVSGSLVYNPDPPPRPSCPAACISQTKFEELSKIVVKLETKLKENINCTEELKRKANIKVGFTATVGRRGVVGPFKRDKFLVYRRVITNIGYAYNPRNGVFTAPCNGIFYFAIFYHAGGERQAMLYLYKNYKLMVMTSDHASRHDSADNGGNAVVVDLEKGDRVYVCLAARTHVWGSFYHTSFSGFLVKLH